MYLMMGFPWFLNAHKLTSQIDIGNYILSIITNSCYNIHKID
jgi:hypothetical protein